MNLHSLPFRLGTSSYIVPDDILPNARYLAGKVRDIELVLFEVDDGPSNLPGPETLEELARLASAYGFTYTVHLPLDLKLAHDGSARDASMAKARRVIECVRPLEPWAYVLHLDGKLERRSPDPAVLSRWREQAVRALEIVAEWAGGPDKLAVENLEGYPPDFNQPVLDRIPVSRCVDIGHLWLDGVPVLPYLEQALPRTRVIHLHGIGERDHASLSHVAPDELDRMLRFLNARYRGVVTVEVFSEADFLSSAEALRSSLARLSAAAADRPELTFILGGARSGKSDYAQELAGRAGGSVLYVATATAGDDEMRARIAAHRAARPAGWRTLEAPLNAADAIARALAEQPAEVVLLDCLTLLASNIILQLPEAAGEREASAALLSEVDALVACARHSGARWIIVSNEVGLGLVPPYPLGRVFRDALGRANQRLAAAADRAVWMAAGIPVPLPRHGGPD